MTQQELWGVCEQYPATAILGIQILTVTWRHPATLSLSTSPWKSILGELVHLQPPGESFRVEQLSFWPSYFSYCVSARFCGVYKLTRCKRIVRQWIRSNNPQLYQRIQKRWTSASLSNSTGVNGCECHAIFAFRALLTWTQNSEWCSRYLLSMRLRTFDFFHVYLLQMPNSQGNILSETSPRRMQRPVSVVWREWVTMQSDRSQQEMSVWPI